MKKVTAGLEVASRTHRQQEDARIERCVKGRKMKQEYYFDHETDGYGAFTGSTETTTICDGTAHIAKACREYEEWGLLEYSCVAVLCNGKSCSGWEELSSKEEEEFSEEFDLVAVALALQSVEQVEIINATHPRLPTGIRRCEYDYDHLWVEESDSKETLCPACRQQC